MADLKRILVAVDFSDTSSHALAYAADLASKLGASLDVIHAYQIPVYALPDGAVMASADFSTRLSNDLQTELDRVSKPYREQGLDVETHLVRGMPHTEIVRRATEEGADLVVVGTHGRTGLEHLLLGSVAERVVRTCPVPVLTVRKPA
ncbi:MAG: universal stress protein [Myxococcota bacterium]